MKKFLVLLLAAVMVFSFAACGGGSDGGSSDSSDEMKVAMVTDYGDITDQSFNQTTYEACKAFCEANDVEFTYKKPASDADADRVSSIEEAIEEGYNVIVMPGYAFANAIYEVAPLYEDVKFVALDVSEGDLTANGEREFDGPNVYSAVYQEEIAGYMAGYAAVKLGYGYAAVKLGYTKLGFLGGMAVPAVQRYGHGFVQGADAAASELGKSDVEIKYVYGGQFFGDADITAAMDTWYGSGTECVFACGGGIYSSAAEAAAKVGGKVIGVDVDQAGIIDGAYGEGMTVTSAMKGLAPTVDTLLGAILAGDWEAYKGQIQTLGLISEVPSDNFVQLPDSTQWGDGFTKDDYATLVGELYAGTRTVSDSTDAIPETTAVKVDDQGAIKG